MPETTDILPVAKVATNTNGVETIATVAAGSGDVAVGPQSGRQPKSLPVPLELIPIVGRDAILPIAATAEKYGAMLERFPTVEVLAPGEDPLFPQGVYRSALFMLFMDPLMPHILRVEGDTEDEWRLVLVVRPNHEEDDGEALLKHYRETGPYEHGPLFWEDTFSDKWHYRCVSYLQPAEYLTGDALMEWARERERIELTRSYRKLPPIEQGRVLNFVSGAKMRVDNPALKAEYNTLDNFRLFVLLHREGHSVETICADEGLTEKQYGRYLRAWELIQSVEEEPRVFPTEE